MKGHEKTNFPFKENSIWSQNFFFRRSQQRRGRLKVPNILLKFVLKQYEVSNLVFDSKENEMYFWDSEIKL